MPGGLRDALDEALASPVVDVSPRAGGFSPGPAEVVSCADGSRAFVQAVGTPLNPHTPQLLRAEAAVATQLPAHLPVPRLRASDWPWAARGPAWVDSVVLALGAAVNGGPDPEALVSGSPVVMAADPRDVTDLLAGLAGLWAVTVRSPAAAGLPTLRAFQRRFHDAALEWVVRRAAGERGPSPLPGWVARGGAGIL